MVKDLDIEGLANFVLSEMKCPSTTDVTISFVTNERIHELNRDYQGIDRPTDVLSFECDNVPFEDEDISAGVEYELGDVIIAPDVALDQTKRISAPLSSRKFLCSSVHLDFFIFADTIILKMTKQKLWKRLNGSFYTLGMSSAHATFFK